MQSVSRSSSRLSGHVTWIQTPQKRQISIGGAPAATAGYVWGRWSGALPIESFEVSRWRSAHRALYGYSILEADRRNGVGWPRFD